MINRALVLPLVASTTFLSGSAYATVLVSDDFEYADGPLNGKTPTVAAGAWENASGTPDEIQVTSGTITLRDSDSEDVKVPYSDVTEGAIYFAFDLAVADPATYTGTSFQYFAHLNKSPNFQARTSLAAFSESGYRPGISSTITAESVWASDLAYGTTYRIVVGYDFATGLSTLWVDPTDPADTHIVSTQSVTGFTAQSFSFRQASASPDQNLTIDRLRVATTFAEVLISEPSTDAGVADDAGSAADSGSGDDAGAEVDAGTSDDGGAVGDAGTYNDAGAEVDAGASDDAGVVADAGAVVDAGIESDAGTTAEDAGAAVDAGIESDAGTTAEDAGAAVDAGIESDAGTTAEDAGAAEDAGSEIPAGTVRVQTSALEAGDDTCTHGGVKFETGYDSDGDGILVGAEITSTQYVCNGADGANGENGSSTLIASQAASRADCAEGGITITVGLDDNGDGSLGETEVDETLHICNGSDGKNGEPGTNGTNGADGADGVDGQTILLATSEEAAGSNCANGGHKIESGADSDGNGTLEPAEVANVIYVCNGDSGATGEQGEQGEQGERGANGTPGANSMTSISAIAAGDDECVAGGVLVQAGPDDNGNGVLDTGEVKESAKVCTGVDGLVDEDKDGVDDRITPSGGASCATGATSTSLFGFALLGGLFALRRRRK